MYKNIFLLILQLLVFTQYLDAQFSDEDLRKFFTNKGFIIEQTKGDVFTTTTYKHIYLCERGYYYFNSSSTFDMGIATKSSDETSMGAWDIKHMFGHTYLRLEGKNEGSFFISHDDKGDLLLQGMIGNFTLMNSCFTQYTVADYKQFFSNSQLRFDQNSELKKLGLNFSVCENGLCQVEEDVYDKKRFQRLYPLYCAGLHTVHKPQ